MRSQIEEELVRKRLPWSSQWRGNGRYVYCRKGARIKHKIYHVSPRSGVKHVVQATSLTKYRRRLPNQQANTEACELVNLSVNEEVLIQGFPPEIHVRKLSVTAVEYQELHQIALLENAPVNNSAIFWGSNVVLLPAPSTT